VRYWPVVPSGEEARVGERGLGPGGSLLTVPWLLLPPLPRLRRMPTGPAGR
jgi:hypothetical protein